VIRRLPVVALLVAALLLAPRLLPDSIQFDLRYERSALAAGEIWRWLTAHLVHLDLQHALLNAAAAAILVVLFGEALDAREWSATMLGALTGVDLGLWFLSPEIEWYAGASGVLHGVIAAGGFALLRLKDWRGPILLLLVGGKLLYEQLTSSGLGFSGGLPVVLDAHAYGAVGGALAYLVAGLRRQTVW
jgi:rhomboid family GlyGly-CTERM serine protease